MNYKYKDVKIKVSKYVPNRFQYIDLFGTVWIKNPLPRRKRERLQKYVLTERLFMSKFGRIRIYLSRLFDYGELYTEMLNEAFWVSNLRGEEYTKRIKWLLPKK